MKKILVCDTGLAFGLCKNLWGDVSVGYFNVVAQALLDYEFYVGKNVYSEVEVLDVTTDSDVVSRWLLGSKVLYVDNVGMGLVGILRDVIAPFGFGNVGEYVIDVVYDKLKNSGRLLRYEIVRGLGELYRIVENVFKWKCVIKLRTDLKGLIETKVVLDVKDFIDYSRELVNVFNGVVNDLVFVVSEYVENVDEYGVDMFFRDGEVVTPWLIGKENGKGYISAVTDRGGSGVVDLCSELVKGTGYNSMMSVEFLVSKDDTNKWWITDVNARFGLPFSLILPEAMMNWSEFVVGYNDDVSPKYRDKYIGGKIINGEAWEDISVYFGMTGFVPSRPYRVKSDGRVLNVPVQGKDYDTVGVVVGYGSNSEEVVKKVNEQLGEESEKWAEGLLN